MVNVKRRKIFIVGTVQGVGFRPFVHQLATKHRLAGLVKNQTGGVQIEVEGDGKAMDEFLRELTASSPPLARIEQMQWNDETPRHEERFRIEASGFSPAAAIRIAPDAATCDDCQRELFDPGNRRYRYPFLNCTHCGPRFTIITGGPYDRERTTMASFVMCDQCRAEYEDPRDRRFHAQPTACPVCGPRLWLRDASGADLESPDPIQAAVESIRAGRVVALKGLGGYHLVCDATNEGALVELRRRKQRDEKPFALMAADLSQVETFCEVTAEEAALLQSRERPIVLLRKKPNHAIALSVAPGNPFLGVMLPYSPLHHLLARQLPDRPMVMTSANQSDEPMVYRDEDLSSRLGTIADVFVTHNRAIHSRCDDSVIRVVGEHPIFIRRSRGYAPASLALPVVCSIPLLALGGQMKSVFALGRERSAILSQHMGDLDDYDAYEEYRRAVDRYEELFEIEPAALAHDLHPDYAGTRYAEARARSQGLKRIGVQHHHAHMASCMADNGLEERVIGVIWDGTGYGSDGTIWGGEFLVGDYRHFARVAHLRCVPMPGGEQAIRQPWRMALAYLLDAGLSPNRFLAAVPARTRERVQQLIEKSLNAPLTSSCGRLFDAVAALLGLRLVAGYEGQPAMELEWLAMREGEDGSYPFELERPDAGSAEPMVVDTRPLLRAIAEEWEGGAEPGRIARRLHRTLVEIIACVCSRLREKFALDTVVLSGGVFMNALLLQETLECLSRHQFRVHAHRRVPSNDGGLCLGQLAIAAAMTA